MRYQRYQRSKSPVRMFLCKPDNRKWLIVTGGLLAVIITLSVILAVTLSGRASGASGARDPANLRQAVDSIDGIPLFTAYIPEDSPGRPGVLRTVESITIHETANTSEGADAEAHSDYLSTTSDEVSWHYTVDDHQIYRHLPDNEEAWHSGDREGNHSSIGIELCVNADGNFDQTMENAAKLTAFLLKEYDLTIDDVKQHYDFNGKDCP
ncbi:MAG: N-acetylmuramoyl-L-alanine amidase family protein [[Clostridium] leptum]